LATIVVPLSYALFTSIIGWFFGGELVNEFNEQQGGGIANEAERLIREFKSFSDSLSAIHKQYIQKIKDASDSFESQLQKVGEAYERMVDTQEVQFDRLSKKQLDLLAQLEVYQKEFIDSQNKCYGEMDNAIQKSINSSDKLNASVDALTSALSTKELFSITSNFVYLSEQTKVASDNMKQVATTSKNVAKYLEESKILIDQLENLLSSINSYRR
jgi:predicted  nucleic acid-binding Zn-ribbon protein